jgi:Predicted ATPase
MQINPFEHNYFLGYISHVNPQWAKIHFPSSVLLNRFIFSGEEFNGGLIGAFVAIEGETNGFIGKIQELDLPERERLELSEKAFQGKEFHPTAKVEILICFDYFNPLDIKKGLDCYPNIGAKVFVCSSTFIQSYFKRFGLKKDEENVPYIDFAKLSTNKGTEISISQQALFSRHCAVVGTTGGGKSWTTSKLIEGLHSNGDKVILIDPTGEYSTFNDPKMKSVILAEDTFLHYRKLTVEDLFFLLKPAGKVQMPKMLEAIRSLKMIELDTENHLSAYKDNGNLIKANKDKRPLEAFYHRRIGEIENGLLSFNIHHLAKQLTAECVYDSQRNNLNMFGDRNETDVSNCVSLISRTSNLIQTALFRNLFGFDKVGNDEGQIEGDLIRKIDSFLNSQDTVLRIGFEKVGYEFQAREILANSIAKYLLGLARCGEFKYNPLVLFVDEAHQYLNKGLKDEQFQSFELNAFDQIAKECRKYGLFLCISTQMPRDIPVGTLSQMGTFIVHRLINHYDKEAIMSACSSANSSILSFLPVLGEGEAIVTGVEFPMPISVRINVPSYPPNSKTPLFKKRSIP